MPGSYDKNFEINSEERNLLLLITKFDYFFNLSLSSMEPHHLAEYLFSLSQAFNSFYTNNKIFSDEVDTVTQVNRIKIVEEFFTTIGLAFNCLGIEAAESM